MNNLRIKTILICFWIVFPFACNYNSSDEETFHDSSHQKINTYKSSLAVLDSLNPKIPFSKIQLYRLFKMVNINLDTNEYYTNNYFTFPNNKRVFVFEPTLKDSLLCIVLDDSGLVDINKFYHPMCFNDNNLHSKLWGIYGKEPHFSILTIKCYDSMEPIQGDDDPRIVIETKFYINEKGMIYVLEQV